MSTRNSIRKLYDEKKDFIIIGLTGRTGSGCSTVAEILATKEYSDLKLRDPKTHDFNNSEEIKYSIIHKYAKESGNWKPFRIIRMTSIITLFMIKKGYDSFVDYLDEINKGLVEFKLDEIKIKLESFSFNDKYKSIHDVYGIIKENKEYSRYPYLISELDNFTRDLKNILEGFGCKSIEEDDEKDHISYSHFYTYLYQKIGNNIRASGDPFCEEFKEDKFFSLAEKCNEIIECIKKYDKSINKPTFICIDAIRNPYEAIFFRDRYADFYLISVNTDDSTRRSRLKDLRVDEINSLDEREYAKKIKGAQKFYNQDIGACLEISDIHVYNPNTEDYFS